MWKKHNIERHARKRVNFSENRDENKSSPGKGKIKAVETVTNDLFNKTAKK